MVTQPGDPKSREDAIQKEIDRWLDLWKHVDGRVGSSLTVLLATVGTATTIVGIYGSEASAADLLLASSWVALFLGISLAVISIRIVATELTKSEYMLSLNMLRSPDGFGGLRVEQSSLHPAGRSRVAQCPLGRRVD